MSQVEHSRKDVLISIQMLLSQAQQESEKLADEVLSYVVAVAALECQKALEALPADAEGDS